LKRLHARIAEFEKAGDLLRKAFARDSFPVSATPEKIQSLNEQLMQVESNWLDPAGIPGRPWFQHLLYSSRYTYAHLEFPGLTEAVEKQDWKLAREQTVLLEKAVQKNTRLLKSAQSSWEKNHNDSFKVYSRAGGTILLTRGNFFGLSSRQRTGQAARARSRRPF